MYHHSMAYESGISFQNFYHVYIYIGLTVWSKFLIPVYICGFDHLYVN